MKPIITLAKPFVLLLPLLCQMATAQAQSPIDVKGAIAFAAQQYEGMLRAHPDTTQFPQSTNADGTPRDMKSSWWCSGFFGGSSAKTYYSSAVQMLQSLSGPTYRAKTTILFSSTAWATNRAKAKLTCR